MNFGIRFRLVALGLGCGLMGFLIVVVTVNSQTQARELRVRLNQVDTESFGMADHFKESLREVNETMRRFRTNVDPAVWAEFLKAGHDLGAWINQQAPKLNTQREKDVLQQIDAAYDEYMRLGEQWHAQLQSSDGISTAPATRFHEQARRLGDLGQLLARTHYESRERLLAPANRALTQLRLSVLWLLGLLFAFAIALALGVYRQMIAPLRVKLVESQALAERNEKLASLGMLAAGVAHEIRNPLTAVKAALFIQQKRFQAGTPERADVELVEREIVRLERIVTQFLQFARPAEPERAVIVADQPLREVETLLKTSLAQGGIQLIREESGLLQINADLAQMKQVLINLVQNAADSIDGGGGVIRLRARHDRKWLATAETDVVILEVVDTGRGISSEVEKRLFDPFFTTKENGTGLGLSIAARIVQKHGGALQYQTRVNHGTTFGIVLPRVLV
jgi:signal transduction histidine kinase